MASVYTKRTGTPRLRPGPSGLPRGQVTEIQRGRIAIDQFEVLHAEGARSGRVMCVALHAYVFGHPHRIDHLDRLLDRLLSHEGVWLTTAEAIADHYLEHYHDDEFVGRRHP